MTAARGALTIGYPFEPRGNTVPYPPLFDDIRQNQGFVDLRGRPDLVGQIPEAEMSEALTALLTALAQPKSTVVSLGCDLGEHLDREAPLKRRRVAGGYVQIINSDYCEQNRNLLLALAKDIERVLNLEIREQTWTVQFELQPVQINLGEPAQTLSIWLWFFAAASSRVYARLSRERLLDAIRCSLQPPFYDGP